MIEVSFKRPDGSNAFQIKHVRSVQWASHAEENVFVDETSRVGKRRRDIVIEGFINKSMFGENIVAQEELETKLRNVGVGTISYSDFDIVDVRFQSLEFSEYRGNPIADFTIRFVTEENNIHAHVDNRIGSITLTPVNGYEAPSVKDTVKSQVLGEQIVNNKARTFSLEGNLVGTTLDEINAYQAALIAEIENRDTVVLTLSSSSGTPGAYTVRTQSLTFGAPRVRDNTVARRYTYEAVTHDDYSKEPYTLGEIPQSFSGIILDVVSTANHVVERDKSSVGPIYTVNEEKLTISGKKYFTGWTAYTAFRDLFSPIPGNTYVITSSTTNQLELVTINVGEMSRDGFSTDESKRYSAQITLNFEWIKSYQAKTYEFSVNHFAINWYEVVSVSFSTTLSQQGHVTERSISVSGTVVGDTEFNNLKGKVGTAVSWDGVYSNLFITSVSVNSVKTINIPGIGQTRVFTVSVSASQLENTSQAFYFTTGLFRLSKAGGGGTTYSADTFLFDNINNRSKSIANRFDGTAQKFIVTSINVNVSGEIFDNDNGSGKPANPDKNLLIFNKIDALLTAQRSNQSGANVHTDSSILPENSDLHFMLTNINIGSWEPFTDQVTGARRWKQTISLSATAVFDLTGSSNTQPDTIETRSENIVLEVPKYQQLNVAGFGTVFKRVGTTPEKLVVTYQKRWRTEELYRQANALTMDLGADNIGEGSWRGAGKNVKSKDEKSNSGLVNRHIVEYQANEKLT